MSDAISIPDLLNLIRSDLSGFIDDKIASIASGGQVQLSWTAPDNIAYTDVEQTFTAAQWIANNDISGKIIYGSIFFEPSELSVSSGRIALGIQTIEELMIGSQAFTWVEDTSAGNQAIHIEGDNKRAVLRFKRSDGTFDAPSAIAAADEVLGGIFAEGYLTNTWPSSSLASLQFVSGQAFTNSHGGTYIRINTTPIDSVTAASVVWIREDGKVGIGDSTPDSLLELGAASGAGYITLNEVSAPSAPAADKLAIYAKDNGSGVTKLYTKNSAGTETELGSGGGGGVSGAMGKACRVYNSGTQSINNNTVTALTFDSERFDNDTLHSTSSNTSRITITTAGIYVITGHILWTAKATSTNDMRLRIRLNGSTDIASFHTQLDADVRSATITTIYQLSAGDYVELTVYQNTGSSKTIGNTGNYSAEFAAAGVG